MALTRDLTANLQANTDQYRRQMAMAESATGRFATGSSSKLGQLGSSLRSVGGTLTRRVTLPLLALGGGAVKVAADFEASFAGMAALAGVSADEIEGLKASVLELSGETAIAPRELAEALFFIRSSGLEGANALDALEASARASAGGLGTVPVLADLVTSAMNAYGPEVLSASEATDILTAAVRDGKAEPDELAASMGRVLPLASEMGVEFHEVAAAMAAMSLSGTDADESATQLNAVMRTILKPTQQAREALAGVGLTADDLRTSLSEDGLIATLRLLQDRFGGNTEELSKVFENSRALQGALNLLGLDAEQLDAIFENVEDSAGATDEAFLRMAETTSFQFAQAWADLEAALISLGEVLLPLAADVAEMISSFANWFGELDGNVQKFIIALLAVAAVIGPLLTLAGNLIRAFFLLRIAATALAAHPVIAIAGAIALAAVAVFTLGSRASTTTQQIESLNQAMEDTGDIASGVDRFLEDLIRGNDELTQSMHAAGLTIEDMKTALRGGPEAWQEFIDRVVAGADAAGLSNAAQGRLITTLESIPDAANAAGRSFLEQEAVLGETADTTGELDDEISELPPDLQALITEVDESASSLGELNAVSADSISLMSDLDREIEALSAEAQALAQHLDRLIGTQVDLQRSEDDWLARLDELQQAIADAKGEGLSWNQALSANTEVGRTNREMIRGSVEDILNMSGALLDAGHSSSEARTRMMGMRAELIAQLMQFGLTERQAESYVNQLGLTPQNISTAVRLAGDEQAKRRIEAYQRVLGDIPAAEATRIQAFIDSGDFAAAERALANLTRTRFATIALSLRGFGAVAGAIHSLRSDHGRFVHGGSNILTTAGERSGSRGDEVILPLGDPRRMAELLGLPQVGPRVVAAFGGAMRSAAPTRPTIASGGGGGTFVQNVTVNMPPGANGDDVLAALQRLQRRRGPLPLRVA